MSMMETEKYMNPFYDASFKRIFGQPENKMLLIDFLNNLLEGERHIKDVTYLDKEQIPENKDLRVIIYDVFCVTDTGEQFIVEMQSHSQKHFIPRTVYYASCAIAKQRKKIEEKREKLEAQLERGRVIGYDYYDVKAVYTIAFLDYTDKSLDSRVRVDAAICDMANARPITGLMRFVYLQLPLFTKKQDECNTFFERWLYVLKNMDILDKLPNAYQCDAFYKLKEVTDLSKLDGKALAEYEAARRNYWDTQTMYYEKAEEGREEGRKEGLEEGLKKGRKEGIEEGLKKGHMKGLDEGMEKGRKQERAKADAEMLAARKETARTLKASGVPLPVIIQAVGLTEEEINAL
jgi:predicted transposase/invertase (TIGR01784 family)